MASVATTMIGQPPPVPSPDGPPGASGVAESLAPAGPGGLLPVAGGVPGVSGMPGVSGVAGLPEVVRRAGLFPRLRYMGSKYRLIPHLASAFTELGGATALDAFSGSGVVSYLL
jgi:hypothetical protein